MSTQETVNKAITAADALASAGRLNSEQVKVFNDYVVDETSFRGNARIAYCDTDWEISTVALGNRGLLPHTEASDPGLRRGVTTSKLVLTPRTMMLPIEITDEFKQENIEGESFEARALRMFATQAANDFEGMAWHGNTLGPAILQSDLVSGGSSSGYVKDGLHSLQDGWVKLASGTGAHIYDAAGAEMSSKLVSKALREMPTKYRQNLANMRLFGSSNLFQMWLETLSDRGTAIGDAVTTGQRNIRPFGILPVSTPLLSFEPKIVKEVTLPGTTSVSLGYTNVSDVVVTTTSLGSTPTVPMVLDTDYSVNTTAGTIARVGGAISDGQTVKVTFTIKPVMILTPANNIVVAFGKDVSIEKARDIYKKTDGYAISLKAAVGLVNADACVFVKNISADVA